MTIQNKPKRYSPYQPDQVAQKYNISIEEATERVNTLKSKTNGSLSTYISRYGEEIGTIKFNEFRSKSKHTLETFIKKYGEMEGPVKYKIYISKKESRSDEYYKNKHGDGWEEIKRVDMENWAYKLSLSGYIDKHGKELGTAMYEEMNSKKIVTVDNYLQKYGEKVGIKQYEQTCKSKDTQSLEIFIRKYGEIEGPIRYQNKLMRCSSVFQNFLKIYPEETAISVYKTWKLGSSLSDADVKILKENKIKTKWENFSRSSVSKSSTKFFTKLEIALGRDIKYGSKRNEHKLFDVENKRTYYYDAYVPSLNLIIEFNGSAFHYHESFEEDWISAFGLTKSDSIKSDTAKLNFARNAGYNVIVVWDFETSSHIRSDTTIAKILKCIELF